MYCAWEILFIEPGGLESHEVVNGTSTKYARGSYVYPQPMIVHLHFPRRQQECVVAVEGEE